MVDVVRVYVVMCPNPTCVRDVQVRFEPGDGVITVTCSHCDEDFDLYVPVVGYD